MKIFNLLDTQYNRFTTAVKSYISKVLAKNGENYGDSTIFGQIITVIGATVQNIMLYIEDAFTEQNKYTAQRKKSIYGLASLSGYQPSTGKAAGVQLQLNFTPTNTQSLNIIINNKETVDKNFELAWKHHYENNPHHPEFWIDKGGVMTTRFFYEMILDWIAVSMYYKSSVNDWYFKNTSGRKEKST